MQFQILCTQTAEIQELFCENSVSILSKIHTLVILGKYMKNVRFHAFVAIKLLSH